MSFLLDEIGLDKMGLDEMGWHRAGDWCVVVVHVYPKCSGCTAAGSGLLYCSARLTKLAALLHSAIAGLSSLTHCAWHTQLAPFTRKAGLLSRIFVHAWKRDMANSFISIRDRRIKIPRVLGHYLLYNGSSTARCRPTSVKVHALLIILSRAPNCV